MLFLSFIVLFSITIIQSPTPSIPFSITHTLFPNHSHTHDALPSIPTPLLSSSLIPSFFHAHSHKTLPSIPIHLLTLSDQLKLTLPYSPHCSPLVSQSLFFLYSFIQNSPFCTHQSVLIHSNQPNFLSNTHYFFSPHLIPRSSISILPPLTPFPSLSLLPPLRSEEGRDDVSDEAGR